MHKQGISVLYGVEILMNGTIWGDIAGVLYFCIFQCMGIFVACKVLKNECGEARLLLGSCIGSFALHWLPVIFAFFMNFSIAAHISALVLFAVICVAVFICNRSKIQWRWNYGREYWALLLIVPFFVCFAALLFTHTIPQAQDGSYYTGQCTYGDMNMHLGFITSIARQQTFPPDYSLLPGTSLNYPFLSDSISSSVYVLGASLRLSYILPMLFAILQVFVGFYLLARKWLKDRSKAMLAWVLFFLNGGFGIIYFLDKLAVEPENFTRIFTSFYETPTNLTAEGNIRWVNVIVDMLLPQRATLFGWAMLFGILYLLYRAVFEGEKKYFYVAGILAGGLPMIHTHSFLALGMVCLCWLVAWLFEHAAQNPADEPVLQRAKRRVLFAAALVFIALFAVVALKAVLSGTGVKEFILSAVFISGMASVLLYVFMIFVITLKYCGAWREMLSTWGAFLLIVLLFALPQLFRWTFASASGENFLRFHFNWGNQNDGYIWFYVKNIGVAALLAVPALIGMKKDFKVAAPILLIWFVAELVVFQPNVYDNNKLLYVAYALLCCICAGYMVEIFRKLKGVGGRSLIAVGVIIACTVSGVLSLGREVVSSYQLYSAGQVKACEYIEKDLPVDAVFLTATNHNNAVASLTGRNIVCGAGTFLYFHGVSYQEAEADVKKMFEAPLDNRELFQKHHVDYIYIGGYERGNYRVKEAEFAAECKLIYHADGVKIYEVPEDFGA